VKAGKPETFTVTVRNNRDRDAASGVTLTDTLPAAATIT